jgi:hypothetical protein
MFVTSGKTVFQYWSRTAAYNPRSTSADPTRT